MGYSKSIKTLEKMRPYLADLERGIATRWELTPGTSADLFAYKIREALNIASENVDAYPDLALAHLNFRIELVDRGSVQAILRRGSAAQGIPMVTRQTGVEVSGLVAGEHGPTTVIGPMDAAKVIGAWHQVQPSNTPMRFPNADLERTELLKLYEWCQKRTPHWSMFVDNVGGLTIQPYSRDMEGLDWDPSDE